MADIFDTFSQDNPDDWALGDDNKNKDVTAAASSFDAMIEGEIGRAIDRKASGKDNPKRDPNAAQADAKILGKFKSTEDLQKAYQELERNLTEKSQKLKKLESAEPLIDAISRDDQLLGMIDEYFNDPRSKSAKKQMGLPEDFQMDINEALENPDSDSAKVFQQIIQSQALKIVEQKEQSRNAKEKLSRQAEELKRKYDLTDDDVNELVRKGQSMALDLEDVYLIVNKDTVMGAAKTQGAKSVIESQQRARRITPSGARQGSATERGEALMDVLLDYQNRNRIPI